MKIHWSTYRITLLLYFGVLLLPISFYFSYSSLNEIKSDTKALNSFTLNIASILTLDNKAMDSYEKQETIKEIDQIFQDLRPWMIENDSSKFYVGSKPLLQKYDSILDCFNSVKTFDKEMRLLCFKEAKQLIFSLDNMIRLKQQKIYNILYLSIFVAMVFLLMLIFFTRVYIHKQLKKHALYDLETRLFTKDYLLVVLKKVSAQMVRSKEPLSVIYINVEDLKSESELSEKEKKTTLKHIGTSLLKSLRVSDIACRYSDSEFIVVLPNTESKKIEKLISRLDSHFLNINHSLKVIEYNQEETYIDFIAKLA